MCVFNICIRECVYYADGVYIEIGQQVELESVATHVVAALFKEFLRNIPGGLLPSSRYTVLVASNDCRDIDDRAVRISRSVLVCYVLPSCFL